LRRTPVQVTTEYTAITEKPSSKNLGALCDLCGEGAWQLKLAKEMKNASLPFDMNTLAK